MIHSIAVPQNWVQGMHLWEGGETMQTARWADPSLRLLVAVLVPELPYLASDHFCHMRLNKHVCRIKHVHDEPLWCRHWGIQINNELRHRYITGEKTEDRLGYQQLWRDIMNMWLRRNTMMGLICSFIRSLPGDEQPLDCINHLVCWTRKLPDWQTTQ